jgi:hypothetical protein
MKRADMMHENRLVVMDVGNGLTLDRLRKERDQVTGMSSPHRHPDLAVFFEAANARTMAGTRIDDDVWTLFGVDLLLGARFHFEQRVVGRTVEGSSSKIISDSKVSSADFHVQEEHGPLRAVEPVVPGLADKAACGRQTESPHQRQPHLRGSARYAAGLGGHVVDLGGYAVGRKHRALGRRPTKHPAPVRQSIGSNMCPASATALTQSAWKGPQYASALDVPHLERSISEAGNGVSAARRHRHGVDPSGAALEVPQFAAALKLSYLCVPSREVAARRPSGLHGADPAGVVLESSQLGAHRSRPAAPTRFQARTTGRNCAAVSSTRSGLSGTGLSQMVGKDIIVETHRRRAIEEHVIHGEQRWLIDRSSRLRSIALTGGLAQGGPCWPASELYKVAMPCSLRRCLKGIRD